MKTQALHGLKLAALPLVLGLMSCSSTAPEKTAGGLSTVAAYTPGVAGGERVDSITEKATVTAIDKEQRAVTLKAEEGSSFTVTLGPEAVNFDQIRVGDKVETTLARSIVVSIADEDAAEVDAAGAAMAGAPKGDQPGGLMVGVVRFSGTVLALDVEKRTATLRFADGSDVVLPVRPDVDMTQYRAGQKVVFKVTGMAAIEVQKP